MKFLKNVKRALTSALVPFLLPLYMYAQQPEQPIAQQIDTIEEVAEQTETTSKLEEITSYQLEQKQQEQKQHKTFSIETGIQPLSYAPDDQLHQTIEKLYSNLRFEIKSWPKTAFSYINLQWYPNENWSFGYNIEMLIPQHLGAEGRVNTILDGDTLFIMDISAHTHFKEYSLGANVKHIFNSNSGNFYMGIGAAVVHKELTLDISLDVFDYPSKERSAYYDGKYLYSGDAFLVNGYFGTEINITDRLAANCFLKYVIFGTCNAKLKSKIEDAHNLGANLSEERIDDKKGTTYLGAGLKCYLGH